MLTKIDIKKLQHAIDLSLPSYATIGSSGVDLLAAIDKQSTVKPGEITLVPTGISIALPYGLEAQVRPRSGLAAKHGITVLNTPGTIDADYRGEIKVILINHGSEEFLIERGMRIAQLVFCTVQQIAWQEVEEHEKTVRGNSGFGSTGR